MEPLQHDPRTKQQVKEALYQFLYGPVQKRYQEQLHQIIVQNTLLIKGSHASFIYKNEFYSNEGTSPPRRMNRLHSTLVPTMEDYLKEINQMNKQEMPYVIGFITQVLNASNAFEDYLKVFPSVLHPPLEKLIASYPCHNRKLTDKEVEKLQSLNSKQIDMIKQRLITNLII